MINTRKKTVKQKKSLRKKKLSMEIEELLQESRINYAKHVLKQKEKKQHHITSPCRVFGNNKALNKAILRAKKIFPIPLVQVKK